MNFYKITGQVTAKCSKFLSNIGFKNIESFDVNHSSIDIKLKDGQQAQIVLNNPGVKGVYWSVGDFEHRASELTGEDWENYYDKNKFQEALNAMVHKHDATIGITWDTIDFWLEEACLKTK